LERAGLARQVDEALHSAVSEKMIDAVDDAQVQNAFLSRRL
jgi:hypothetical protein